jgi:hypothetical protein
MKPMTFSQLFAGRTAVKLHQTEHGTISIGTLGERLSIVSSWQGAMCGLCGHAAAQFFVWNARYRGL